MHPHDTNFRRLEQIQTVQSTTKLFSKINKYKFTRDRRFYFVSVTFITRITRLIPVLEEEEEEIIMRYVSEKTGRNYLYMGLYGGYILQITIKMTVNCNDIAVELDDLKIGVM